MMSFYLGLGFLSLLAYMFVFPYAKLNPRLKGLTLVYLPLASLGIFAYFGQVTYLKYYYHASRVKERERMPLLRNLMAKFKKKEYLLKMNIADEPKAENWWALGELYHNMKQLDKAANAYFSAYKAEPDNLNVLIKYILTEQELNGGVLSQNAKELSKILLKSSKHQDSAKHILAIDAYQSQNFKKAIKIWQELKANSPKNPNLAKKYDSLIEKAELELKK